MAESQEDTWPNSLMWYTNPADKWEDSLPIGNGKLAAMISGNVQKDRIALNHEWLWRGKHRDRTISSRHEHLQEVRDLFFKGDVLAAGNLANEKLGGSEYISDTLARIGSYQPAGDLHIELDHQEEDYRRQLDLDQALATVSYSSNNTCFTRKYFVHSQFPVIAIRLCSNRNNAFRARFSLNRAEDPECVTAHFFQDEVFGFRGRFEEGIQFAVAAKILSNGRISLRSDGCVTTEGSEILILLSITVHADDADPLPACLQHLSSAPTDWQTLLDSHVREHQKLYRRVKLEIGEDMPDLDTAMRLRYLWEGRTDEAMYALCANFGRYLLISSSRKCDLPANLRGKWNDNLQPPWFSDYHFDVNLEMNYWPTETSALKECAQPLFDYIHRMLPHAREMATAIYGCKGVLLPIASDAWDRATPESRGWDVWTGGAAWIAQHFWWQYEYSLSEEFLREQAYPFMKEVAAFYQDYLVPHPEKDWLVAVPSQSPENTFLGGTWPVSLCVSSTMDVELIHEVLTHAIEASEILDVDAEDREIWRNMLSKLPPFQIGRHGQLQEWLEDYEDEDPGHRHLSHLYAMYPGDQITVENEPELSQAVRKSIERRLIYGSGTSGFTLGWVACLYARLHDGDLARQHVRVLVGDYSSPNLFSLYLGRIFSIDANFAITACVFEMLLQSHRGIVRILPALPRKWSRGSVSGLKARSNFTVDIDWAENKPTRILVTSGSGRACRLKCQDVASAKLTCKDSPVTFTVINESLIEFKTAKNGRYELTFEP